MRQRPDFFVKRSARIVNCTKNKLKVPDKEISQSVQHNKKTSHGQRFKGFEAYNYMILPRTGWKYFPQQIVFIRALGVESKLDSLAIFNVEHRRTCCRSDFDRVFSCSGSCFSHVLGNRRECEPMHPHIHHIILNMYRYAQSDRTSIMMLHAHTWLKFKMCLPQK